MFAPNGSKITDSNGELATMSEENGIYKLHTTSETQIYAATCELAEELWHKRLGHINHRSMLLLNQGMATGIKYNEKTDFPVCTSCVKDKMSRLTNKEYVHRKSWNWCTQTCAVQWRTLPSVDQNIS